MKSNEAHDFYLRKGNMRVSHDKLEGDRPQENDNVGGAHKEKVIKMRGTAEKKRGMKGRENIIKTSLLSWKETMSRFHSRSYNNARG